MLLLLAEGAGAGGVMLVPELGGGGVPGLTGDMVLFVFLAGGGGTMVCAIAAEQINKATKMNSVFIFSDLRFVLMILRFCFLVAKGLVYCHRFAECSI